MIMTRRRISQQNAYLDKPFILHNSHDFHQLISTKIHKTRAGPHKAFMVSIIYRQQGAYKIRYHV
jgi:hypothetical protein